MLFVLNIKLEHMYHFAFHIYLMLNLLQNGEILLYDVCSLLRCF